MTNHRDQQQQPDPVCDRETGLCAAPPLLEDTAGPARESAGWELVYIGDPMCTWCWGVAPVVASLPDYCERQGAAFAIVAGGLAPGGGYRWDARFRTFLRDEWVHVGKATGQPFALGLLERDQFDFDTEPPCRAVVVARSMLAERDRNACILAAFFAAVQRGFFFDNLDPATLAFYRDPVAEVGLDFDAFTARFESEDAKRTVQADFRLNRGWGVQGFPSFALRRGDAVDVIAGGYVDLPTLGERVRRSRLTAVP